MSTRDARTGDVDLPVGVVTFVLTDVVGSSRLWEKDPETAKRALLTHRRLIDEVVARWDGARPPEQGEGDSTLSAFERARNACAFALDIQEALRGHPDTEIIRLRVAIHTGEAQLMDSRNYLAAPVNRCARLRGLAHPGQILLSRTTWEELAQGGLDPEVETKDLGMHRLKDLARPEHVFQIFRAGRRSEFPPLSSIDAFTNNLPVQLTSFVGRDDDVRELTALMSRNRHVTLSGPGGGGKTRLSLQVAAEVVTQFADGVWFVELAAVTEADQVAAEVANALLLQPGPMQSSLETSRAYLKERTSLIVLDNCEHVVEACAEIADTLLRECPRVSLLATSREPLGVEGEVVWRVPPLSTPSQDQVHASAESLESLLDFGALRLFVERATQVQKDFVIDGSSAAPLSEICRRLDGVPLAIELAAARLRFMRPQEILVGLEDSFRLLRGGSRSDLSRHRTLEASVDWSYSLLSESEQILVARLGVFWGFTLEQVEKVCGFDPLDPGEVIDLLANLVDKSLVHLDEDRVQTRYRLLETIRQFSTRKLLDRGETNDLRSRQAAHFLDLLEQGGKPLEEGNIEWVDRLDSESDNLRSAIQWTFEGGDASSVLRVSPSLAVLAATTRRAEEAKGWIDHALEQSAPDEVQLRATGLLAKALIATYELEIPVLLPIASEAHALFTSLNDQRGIARSSIAMGYAQTLLGDFDQGVAQMEGGLEIARRTGHVGAIRAGLVGLGHASILRDPSEARAYLDECLQMYPSQRIADVALATAYLSWCDILQGRWDAALRRSTKAAQLARDRHERQALAIGLANQAEALLNMGKLDHARDFITEAQRLCYEIQEVGGYAYALSVACRLELADGNLAVARDAGVQSVSILAGLAPTLNCFFQLALAYAELEDGDLIGAKTTLSEATETADAYSLAWPRATAAFVSALVAVREDAPALAEQRASDALIRFAAIDSQSGVIETLELIAEIAFSMERYADSAQLLAVAHAHRELTNFVVYPIHKQKRDQLVSDLRIHLAGSFDDAWDAGLSMDLGEAVAAAQVAQ